MSKNLPIRPPPPGQRNRDKRNNNNNYYGTSYSPSGSQTALTLPPPPPPPSRNHGVPSPALLASLGGGGTLTAGLGGPGMGLTPPFLSKSASASASASAPASEAEAIHGPIREPARDTAATPDRLIVGVDFGTTFSGVAAVYTPTPDDIEIIKTWPGGNGITSDKVPTELMYSMPADAAPGTEPTVRWGFQFKPEEARLRCIKLFLDRSQKLPFYVSPLETAAQLSRHGKTVVDAAADYLTQVYRHTMDTLGRRYGASFMASTRVDFVLTCPAVWSDAAKNTTLLAAERAGMGDRAAIQMISEPEAAAVYTLKAIQPSHLNVGDNVIVCDAGGGTVE